MAGRGAGVVGLSAERSGKPQPNHIYSDFMNELRKGVGQEIFRAVPVKFWAVPAP